MHLSTFIIAVFYEVDNWFMGQKKLRRLAPSPNFPTLKCWDDATPRRCASRSSSPTENLHIGLSNAA